MEALLSPYRCGSENGLRFGAYLIVFYAIWFLSPQLPLLALLWPIAALAGPVVLYRLMAADRNRMASPAGATLGWLWIDGLFTALCGSLVAAAAMFIYLRWLDPAYLERTWQVAMEALNAADDPDLRNLAANSARARENGFSISPILFTMTMLWFGATLGSLLALINALILRMRPSKPVKD